MKKTGVENILCHCKESKDKCALVNLLPMIWQAWASPTLGWKMVHISFTYLDHSSYNHHVYKECSMHTNGWMTM